MIHSSNRMALVLLFFALAPACSDDADTVVADAGDSTSELEDISETRTDDTTDTDVDDADEVVDPVLLNPPTNEALGQDPDAHQCESFNTTSDPLDYCYQGKYTYKCDGEQPVQWQRCPDGAQVCSSSFTGCVEGTEIPDCPSEGFHQLCSGVTRDGRGAIVTCSDGRIASAFSCRRDVPACGQTGATASCSTR